MDTDRLIKEALTEDIGSGDITTDTIFKKDINIKAAITAKEEAVVCGIDIAEKVFRELDKSIEFRKLRKDSEKASAGEDIAEIEGSARAILAAERTALNFLGHLSGIATHTKRFADLKTRAKILDTRKTTPCLRELEKYAVRCGGGKNHRMGLYDMILIKDNHIKAAGSIKKALSLAKQSGIKTEIECSTLDEVNEVLESDIPEIVMLDNMTAKEMKKAVKLIGRRAKTEASGGINLRNIREIDATGVDFISMGALTKNAPHIDYSLNARI